MTLLSSTLLTSLPRLFVEGGTLAMSILTVLLVAMLFAAWTAPAWVRNIGRFALAYNILHISFGWYKAGLAVEIAKDIHPALVWGGIKCCAITLAYGLIIYLASLLINTIQTPRA